MHLWRRARWLGRRSDGPHVLLRRGLPGVGGGDDVVLHRLQLSDADDGGRRLVLHEHIRVLCEELTPAEKLPTGALRRYHGRAGLRGALLTSLAELPTHTLLVFAGIATRLCTVYHSMLQRRVGPLSSDEPYTYCSLASQLACALCTTEQSRNALL